MDWTKLATLTHKLKLTINPGKETTDLEYDENFALFERLVRDVQRLHLNLSRSCEHAEQYCKFSNRFVGHIGNFFHDAPARTPCAELSQTAWRAHSRLNKTKFAASGKVHELMSTFQVLQHAAARRAVCRREMDYYVARAHKVHLKRDAICANGGTESEKDVCERVRLETELQRWQSEYQSLNSELTAQFGILASNRRQILTYLLREHVRVNQVMADKLRGTMAYMAKDLSTEAALPLPTPPPAPAALGGADTLGAWLARKALDAPERGGVPGPPEGVGGSDGGRARHFQITAQQRAVGSSAIPSNPASDAPNPSSSPAHRNRTPPHEVAPLPARLQYRRGGSRRGLLEVPPPPAGAPPPAALLRVPSMPLADRAGGKAPTLLRGQDPGRLRAQTLSRRDIFDVPSLIPTGARTPSGRANTQPRSGGRVGGAGGGADGAGFASLLRGMRSKGQPLAPQCEQASRKKKLKRPCPFLGMGIACAVEGDPEHAEKYYHADQEACAIAARPTDWVVEPEPEWSFAPEDPLILYNPSDTDADDLASPQWAQPTAHPPPQPSPQPAHHHPLPRPPAADRPPPDQPPCPPKPTAAPPARRPPPPPPRTAVSSGTT